MMNSLVTRPLFDGTPASLFADSADFAGLWRDFDGLFDGVFGSPVAESGRRWWPSLESYEKDGQFHVRMDVPGVDPKDIEVSLTGNILRVAGERKAEREGGYREIEYGRFERTFVVPDGVDAEKIRAKYVNGVLELTIALPASAQPTKVPVQIREARHLTGAVLDSSALGGGR